MLSKLILFLSSILVLMVIFDRIQNNIVFKFYFTYEVREDDVAEKLLFRDHLKKFNKSYGRAELQMRYRYFKENLVKIEELNRASRHATYGITKFSDWTDEELAAILLPNVGNCEPRTLTCPKRVDRSAKNRSRKMRKDCCKKKRRSRHVINNLTDSELPYWRKERFGSLPYDEECKCKTRPRVLKKRRIEKTILHKLDWRERNAVGPILDQKRCPVCWAFSIIGVLESRAFIQNYTFNRLSIQELIDCSFHNEKDKTGCHSGRSILDALKFLCTKQLRITTEANYPLTLVDERCHRGAQEGRGISKFVNSCNMYEDETKLLEVLNDGPVTAMVNAYLLFNYNGGIIAENCEATYDKLNHAVQLVGYDTTGDTPYYILRNSWGADWGEGGYARLAIGGNQCGVASSIGYFDVN